MNIPDLRIIDLRRFPNDINRWMYSECALVTHKMGQIKILAIRDCESMKI